MVLGFIMHSSIKFRCMKFTIHDTTMPVGWLVLNSSSDLVGRISLCQVYLFLLLVAPRHSTSRHCHMNCCWHSHMHSRSKRLLCSSLQLQSVLADCACSAAEGADAVL